MTNSEDFMQRYLNLSGKSNVEYYEIGETFISVKFKGTHKIYSYSYNLAGKSHVDIMKSLAQKGCGLNSHINKYVRKLYDK